MIHVYIYFFFHIFFFECRWHNLTIMHDNRTVFVYLDGEESKEDIIGNIYHLGLDPRVFIGGGKNFVITRGK